MKILVVLGSPRKNGNSETLVGKVISGAENAGAACEVVRLSSLNIHPCIGCGGCEKEGICVIDDDMQKLYPKITDADRIIIASPIYFYGVTAQTKAFIDRCQALWSRKYILGRRLEERLPRIGYYVGVSATRGERIFEGAILSVKYAFDAMDFEYGDECVVRGVDRKGAVSNKEKELSQAYAFGTRIASG